jgi:heme exporter protein A
MRIAAPEPQSRVDPTAVAGAIQFGTGIELDRIAHRFGDRWVLRGCSLSVPRGTAVALLGGNGAGKTTLLKIVATLLRATRGDATVFGLDLRREADGVRRHLGMLGHSPALYEDLTAAENIRFACRMLGLVGDPATIAGALERVGLSEHAHSRVRGFSAGMRRRVALGRILVHPPKVLLMDEPYASFDEEGIRLTNDLVRDVLREGGCVLCATHDLPRSREVVTSAVRIADGLLYPVELEPIQPNMGPRGDGKLGSTRGTGS